MVRKVFAFLFAVTAIVMLAVGGLTLFSENGIQGLFETEIAELPPPDPREVFETPFLNVRVGVAYTGDRSCAACHTEHDNSYHNHPMGLSATVDFGNDHVERLNDGHETINAFGGAMDLTVDQVDGKMVHRADVKAKDGTTILTDQADIVIGIGSGTRGRSYLCERGGGLYQSPLSWFGEKAIWQVSPGYPFDKMFSRRMTAACLYCHVDLVESSDKSLTFVREAKFQEQVSIGCERCHGPGELHVAARLRDTDDSTEDNTAAVKTADYTIVNPIHLDPDLRDGICQQCHLQGEARVDRRGQSMFNYRPGLPIEQFWTIFQRAPEMTDYHKSVGQFEQMNVSKCSIASQRKLACYSCHDPHEKAPLEKRSEYYQTKCLSCHQEQSCTETSDRRLTKSNDCIACHMPKGDSTNIVHTSVTDHRIPRFADAPSKPLDGSLGSISLVPFNSSRYSPSAEELDRDLGIAMAIMAEKGSPLPSVNRMLEKGAASRLGAATKRHKNDLDAWVNESTILSTSNPAMSLAAAKKALAIDPDHETALYLGGAAAWQLKRTSEAKQYLSRLVELIPSDERGNVLLGGIQYFSQEWDDAERSCRLVLKYHPLSRDARIGLAAALYRKGLIDEANVELEKLLAVFQDGAGEIRQLYDQLIHSN